MVVIEIKDDCLDVNDLGELKVFFCKLLNKKFELFVDSKKVLFYSVDELRCRWVKMYPSFDELNEREVWVLKEFEICELNRDDCLHVLKCLNQELLVIQELKELYKLLGR